MRVRVQAPARGQKRKRLEDENHILGGVTREETREETLVQRLTEHVERIDTDMVRERARQPQGNMRWDGTVHSA